MPCISASGLFPLLRVVHVCIGGIVEMKLFPFLLDAEFVDVALSYFPPGCQFVGLTGMCFVHQSGHGLEGHCLKRSKASSGKLLHFGGSLWELM